ncbi:MAG: helix-turn-helix transcriptional regulator [Planctomycetes bacterium]|nr:helix-turn-helix transcriptional regulator [Planctomycetota bacterium]
MARIANPSRADPGSALIGAGHIFNKSRSNPASGTIGRVLPAYALVYLLEGGGHYEDDAIGRRAVSAGDAIVLFPGMRHSYGPFDQPLWSECWIIFRGGVFSQLEAEGLIDRSRPVITPGLRPELIAAFDALIRDFNGHDPRLVPVLAARTHGLVADFARCDQERGPRADAIAVACARLGEALDRPLDLERLARGIGLGAERFRKVFALSVGIPPARYRQLRRIDRAKQLLATTLKPLAAIARELGYCDEYFFSRQFKHVTGLSPARFRRDFGASAGA